MRSECVQRRTHEWIDPMGLSVSLGDKAIKCVRCGIRYVEWAAEKE